MKNNKIAIIGHFGGNEERLDGQTIKTKILYDELKSATEWEILKVDTYYKNKKPIKLIKDTLACVLKTNDIIILISQNGMKVYFPLLMVFSKLFNIKVYHDVIGGNLDKYVKQYPRYKKYLNSFKVNWVETAGMKQRLKNEGINNCEVIPNFKRLEIAKICEEKYMEPFKFCIFSRVMKEKGIEIAIEAIQKINAEAKRTVCELDIYGQVDDKYEQTFQAVMSKITSSIRYKGEVPYKESTKTLQQYYALLFPTFWDGEGFPGTVIDAFSAGIPVIGSDWNCNKEIITHKVNGIIYPNSEMENLQQAIKWLIEQRETIDVFKKNCIDEARRYQPDCYINKMIKEIECAK